MRGEILAFLLATSSLTAVPQSIPKSDGPPITPRGFVFPVIPGPTPSPVPAPTPTPGAVPVLTAERVYVVPSDEPFLLFASPAGLVKVTKESGPLKIRGKFLDGSDTVETRTYSAKNVAIVEPVAGAKGRVELIAVPAGVADEANAVRQMIDVNHGAQPPPTPVDPVDPVDPPKPVESFRVIWIHESGATIPQAQISVMDAKVVRDYLNANCTKNENWAGWRRWDKDTDAAKDFPVFRDLWAAVKPKVTTVPCVAIEVNGKVSIEPFPKTPQDAIALFKKFNGGK